MEEKKKSSIAVIVILVLIIIGLVGYIYYDKFLSKDDSTTNNVQTNETLKENEEKKDELNVVEGQYYLLEGRQFKRRYYLAFDKAEMREKDNRFIDFREIKVYLVDMNLSKTNNFIKEIDFSKIIENVYNEKINSLPDILAEGSVNETKKTDINKYIIQYVEINSGYYMFDGEKEIPFGISYTGIHDYEGRSNVAELSLGTEYYVLDVSTMTVRKVS
ncbi:MAG: hypothetical protein ACI4ON_05435 [Clostridia bacterium]